MSWRGCIVEESLEDNRVLNDLHIIKLRITDDADFAQRWHIYDIIVDENKIKLLHKQLKDKWYMHFWKDNQMMILFQDKRFLLDMKDIDARKKIIAYGVSLGIPKEQLDFKTES